MTSRYKRWRLTSINCDDLRVPPPGRHDTCTFVDGRGNIHVMAQGDRQGGMRVLRIDPFGGYVVTDQGLWYAPLDPNNEDYE